jgi:rod shape-determining protein MreB
MAIVKSVKDTHGLLIGPQTAEQVKIEIGSAIKLENELKMSISGRDFTTGLPRKVEITSQEVRDAMSKPVSEIINAIRAVLERTPPELAADIVHQGIVLAGGGALLRGIDKAVSQAVDLPVTIADDPLTAVARGTSLVLERLDLLSQILESEEE